MIDEVSLCGTRMKQLCNSTDLGLSSKNVSQSLGRIQLLLAHALDELGINEDLVWRSELEGVCIQGHRPLVALAPFCAHLAEGSSTT